MDEPRYRVRRRLTENLALLRAREIENLARTRDGNIGEPALLLDARSIVHAVHMREKRLLHARREHAVELEALRGVHGHERDCLAVFPHGVQIGTQAHPFDEIGKRIPAKDARRFRIAGNRVPFRRRGELRVVFLMRLRELVDNAHELLDVLDAPARLVSVLVGERRDEPRAIDDHLHHAAQLA